MCDGGDGPGGDGDTGMAVEEAGQGTTSADTSNPDAGNVGPVGVGGGGTGPGSVSAAVSAGVASVANAAAATANVSETESADPGEVSGGSGGNVAGQASKDDLTTPPAPIMSEEVVNEETGETAMVEVAHASVTQGQVDAATAAIQSPEAVNQGFVNSQGMITLSGVAAMGQPIGSNPVAQGAHSVVGSLAANSEVAQAAADANPNNPGASSGVSVDHAVAMSAQAVDPSTGLMTDVINIPNPPMGTPAFNQAVTSSFIAGALNPDMSAAISTIGMAMMPMPMAMAVGSMQAAQADALGLPPPGGLLSAFGSITDDSSLTSLSNTVNAAQIAVGQGIGNVISGVLGTASDFLDQTIGVGMTNLDAAITEAGVSAGLFDAVDPDIAAATAAATAASSMGTEDVGDLGGGEVDAPPTPAPVVDEPSPDARRAANVVSEVDTFLDTGATTSLISIPDLATQTLGDDEDLGVATMVSNLSRGSSFRRSRVTSPKDRAFGAASLFRPTLSAGISL